MRKLFLPSILALTFFCLSFKSDEIRYGRQFKSYTEQISGEELNLRSGIFTIQIFDSLLMFGDHFMKGFIIDSLVKDSALGSLSILTRDNWSVSIGREDVKLISPKKDTMFRFYDPLDEVLSKRYRGGAGSEVARPYNHNNPDRWHGMPIYVPSGEGFNMPVYTPDSSSHGFLLIAGVKKPSDYRVLKDSTLVEQLKKDSVNSLIKK